MARRHFPARRNEFPVPDHRESVATTAESLRNLGAWVRQEGPVSKDFPVFSLQIRDFGETGSLQTASTAIRSAGAEIARAHSRIACEFSAIPRGLGRRGLARPNRRLRVRGLEETTAGNRLCWQFVRFGFAFIRGFESGGSEPEMASSGSEISQRSNAVASVSEWPC